MTEPTLYDQVEIIRGRPYRYDPDHDIWRPVPTEESPVSQWLWVGILLAVALLAYTLEVLG
jgi:hypothetical protein